MSHPNQAGGGNASSGSTPPSPMQSFMRFFSPRSGPQQPLTGSPSHAAAVSGGGGVGAPGQPLRSLSDPNPAHPFAHSPALSTASHRPHAASLLPAPQLLRTRSLDSDTFALPEAHGASGGVGGLGGGGSSHPPSPSHPMFRTFSISSGLPVAEAAQSKRKNSFLELLARQDSFMSND